MLPLSLRHGKASAGVIQQILRFPLSLVCYFLVLLS